MSRYNKLPFQRGKSAFQNNSTDLTITSLAHLEGQKVYLPNAAAATPEVRRNGIDVVAVVVRNDSGGTLAAGEALWWKTAYHGTRVTKTTAADNSPVAGFVDAHVGSGGVQDDDLFYMIVECPCVVKTLSGGTAHASTELREGGLVVASGTAGKGHASNAIADSDGADAATEWNVCGRVMLEDGLSADVALGTDTLINVKINA